MPQTSRKIFDKQDQFQFAALSGDDNAIHVDDEKARRLLFGEVVVHGANLLLTALDCSPLNLNDKIEKVRARFLKPAKLGRVITFHHVETATGFDVRIKDEADLLAVISVSTHANQKEIVGQESHSDLENGYDELPFEVDEELFTRCYPCLGLQGLSKDLSPILMATKIVGTIEPGEHSLFTQLELNRYDGAGPVTPQYRVLRRVEAVGLVSQELLTAHFQVIMDAYYRPSPVLQPPLDVLTSMLAGHSFVGRKALVIGGSRGIGETVTKLLALGDAEVTFTYRQGVTDARLLSSMLQQDGRNVYSCHFDVLDEDDEDDEFSQLMAREPDTLYYFATPRIFRGQKAAISLSDISVLTEYYATAFFRVAHTFLTRGGSSVFYPSTVYIDEKPHKFKEYVLAKISGEVICDYLRKEFPKANIVSPRLPKLMTDQHQSLVGGTVQDTTAEVVVKELRAFYG